MDEYIRQLFAFNHDYCETLLADIAEEEMLLQPSPEVNSPTWLLGHLAICTDFALGILGQEKKLSKRWLANFGPGTKPSSDTQLMPSKQELWDAYSTGHDAVNLASVDIEPALLSAPNPIEFLVSKLPTSGALLAHLMTTHEAVHLGHLSNWRRQTGRPPLF